MGVDLGWLLWLLAGVAHWPQPVQSDYLLSAILLILDLIPFFQDFLNEARIELPIARKDGLAVSSFVEELRVGLLEYFKQIGGEFDHLVIAVSLDLGSLFLDIDVKDD